MGERDAFGNEKDDNPLAGMGWSTGGLSTPSEPATAVTPPAKESLTAAARAAAEAARSAALQAQATAKAAAANVGSGDAGMASSSQAFGASSTPQVSRPTPPAPSSLTGLPRYRSSGGVRLTRVLLAVVLPIAIIGGVAASLVSVGSNVTDQVDNFRTAISTGLDSITVPTVPVPETPAVPATPPTGFGEGSLLLKSNFAAALRTLSSEGARAQYVRVAADRINASIITAGGEMRNVQVTWQDELRRLSSTAAPGGVRTFALSSLTRAAPFRLSRSAAGRAKRAPASVDYLVTVEALGRLGWTVVLKNGGGQYLADGGGRITRKIG